MNDFSNMTAENVAKAMAAMANTADFKYFRYSLLRRLVDAKQYLGSRDPAEQNRALGIVNTVENILADFGEQAYGGLPTPNGIPDTDAGLPDIGLDKIGGGFPHGLGI